MTPTTSPTFPNPQPPTLPEKILASIDRAVDAIDIFFADPVNPESPDPRKLSAGMLVLKRALEMHDAITAKQNELYPDENDLMPPEEFEALKAEYAARHAQGDNYNEYSEFTVAQPAMPEHADSPEQFAISEQPASLEHPASLDLPEQPDRSATVRPENLPGPHHPPLQPAASASLQPPPDNNVKVDIPQKDRPPTTAPR
jgi:hypothetical protein